MDTHIEQNHHSVYGLYLLEAVKKRRLCLTVEIRILGIESINYQLCDFR